MSKGGYKIFDQGGLYYVSFAVAARVDLPCRQAGIFYKKRLSTSGKWF